MIHRDNNGHWLNGTAKLFRLRYIPYQSHIEIHTYAFHKIIAKNKQSNIHYTQILRSQYCSLSDRATGTVAVILRRATNAVICYKK